MGLAVLSCQFQNSLPNCPRFRELVNSDMLPDLETQLKPYSFSDSPATCIYKGRLLRLQR